jgi:hypothetical protein
MPQSTQGTDELVRRVQVGARVLRPAVGLLHLKSRSTFRRQQRCPESDVHLHSLLGTRRRLRERLKQLQPFGEMTDGFEMGGALDGLLPSVLPILDRLFWETCRRILMRYKFWLCRCDR